MRTVIAPHPWIAMSGGSGAEATGKAIESVFERREWKQERRILTVTHNDLRGN